MLIIIIKNIITNIIGAIVFQKMYPGVLVRSSIGGTSPILSPNHKKERGKFKVLQRNFQYVVEFSEEVSLGEHACLL